MNGHRLDDLYSVFLVRIKTTTHWVQLHTKHWTKYYRSRKFTTVWWDRSYYAYFRNDGKEIYRIEATCPKSHRHSRCRLWAWVPLPKSGFFPLALLMGTVHVGVSFYPLHAFPPRRRDWSVPTFRECYQRDGGHADRTQWRNQAAVNRGPVSCWRPIHLLWNHHASDLSGPPSSQFFVPSNWKGL